MSEPATLDPPAAPLPDPAPADGGPVARRGGDAWYQLRRRPLFWAAAAALLLAGAMAAVPSAFTRLGPEEGCDLLHARQGPSAGHPFGYDVQGCDYWSQVVHGARPSLLVGTAVTLFALAVAVVLGTLAGYFGGAVDTLVSRLTDVFFGLPFVLGATVILVAFPGHGIWAVTLALVALGWTTMTRIMRSQVVALREADHVTAARALGAGHLRLMGRHILPNAFAPVFVVAMLNVGNVIAGEATLDYLGVGLQYPTVSWGIQLNMAQDFYADHPHLLAFPALFLSVTVLGFLLLGDTVRDALDPRLR